MSTVETFQVPWELDQLITVVDGIAPRSVLEIGCWKGGTLWHWIDQPTVERVVAVDDAMRNAAEWLAWAERADVELHTIQGRSQEPEVVNRAAALGPYDLVFIDGDHTTVAVDADFRNYAPMVADDGVIVFHDIIPRPGYGVSVVWDEVKTANAKRWIEIGQRAVEPGNEGTCGIGVAWL